MCLAVPAKLRSQHGTDGIVDVHGSRIHVSTLLVPDAVEGDWLLVHAGFAIQRLSEHDALETWAALNLATGSGDPDPVLKKRGTP